MPEVGVRELKERASEIVREVREHRTRYTVTYRGVPVGVLLPLAEAQKAESHEAWDRLVQLGQEIGAGWCSPLTSDELLSEMRR